MRTGASDVSSRGFRGKSRQGARLNVNRKARLRRAFLESETLESRTLLATIPAAAATGAAINLSGLGTVTGSGNANSPTVVVDPYDSQKLFAVWGVDLSTLNPVPHTTAVVEGAYSSNGGANWTSLGQSIAQPQRDVETINANPPTNYTQVTEPSVAFDGLGNVYVLSLQTTGAADGELFLTKLNFSSSAPVLGPSQTIYQWVGGSDAATTATIAVDAAPANPPTGVPADPHANNVYIAWASIDTEPANTNPYLGPGFNANRAEVVVGTPITTPSGNEESLAFSAVKTVNVNGNFGPQDNSHPQLVINQNASGQITVAWDDFGSGAKASPAFDNLEASLVQAGDSYGFTGSTGLINPAIPPPSGSTTTTPVATPFTASVSVPNPSAINNLTVAVDLIDFAAVSNLSLVLQAPNGSSITLVRNQVDDTGKANVSQGLPSGNAIGQFGFTTGTNGTPGIPVGTIFDDNATRSIFDGNTANPVANGNTATDYIGYFRPEVGSLKTFLSLLGGNINGTWTLVITNFAAGSSTSPAFGSLNEFKLTFSSGMTSSAPSLIARTLVTGAIGNTFPELSRPRPTVSALVWSWRSTTRLGLTVRIKDAFTLRTSATITPKPTRTLTQTRPRTRISILRIPIMVA